MFGCIRFKKQINCLSKRYRDDFIFFFSLLFPLMFNVLLFRIPTKSIVHNFFCWSHCLLHDSFEWKRILYGENLWKIIFRSKISSDLVLCISVWLINEPIKNERMLKILKLVADFSVMIYAIIIRKCKR